MITSCEEPARHDGQTLEEPESFTSTGYSILDEELGGTDADVV